jgi:hypothetical protein
MRTIAVFAAAGAVVVLASCSTGAPVSGQMERSDERFTGAFTGGGFRSGPGELILVSSRNVTCKGSVVYTTPRRGEGVLNCNDGRTGPVHLSGFDSAGSGFGDLSGQRFTFTFGRT